MIANRHTNEGNDYEFNLASNFRNGGRDTYLRTVEDGAAQPWRKLITAEGNGNVGIGTDSPSTKLHVNGNIQSDGAVTANEMYNNGWYRSNGNGGWYSQTYGGGWHMTDSSWIRGYNGKGLWMGAGLVGSDKGLTIGYGGTSTPNGGAIVAGNVGIGTASPSTNLDVVGNIKAGGSPVPSNRYNIQGGSVGVSTVYGYTALCAGNNNGDCGGPGGVVIGLTNNNANINLQNNGNAFFQSVGIGTTNPSQKLHVNGYIRANGYYYNSDRRYKSDIKDLESPLTNILKLSGYSYFNTLSQKKDIGVIAQEVEKVYPEIVHTDTDGYKSVQYGNLVAPIIEAINLTALYS